MMYEESVTAMCISSKQRSSSDCKLTVAYDDTSIYFDGTTGGNNIYMDVGIPISSCKLRIGIAEGHMISPVKARKHTACCA
jgi:hypothetical protein